jgi:hypothetical protein
MKKVCILLVLTTYNSLPSHSAIICRSTCKGQHVTQSTSKQDRQCTLLRFHVTTGAAEAKQ